MNSWWPSWGRFALLATLIAAGAGAAPPARAATEVVLAPAAPADAGFSAPRLARLNDAMHHAVDQGEVAGVMTMLVRHGKIVSYDAYGRDSIARGTKLQRDAIFRMYSQTKPITGVAMMMLFEQGKWRLSDPVEKFIPQFANLKVFVGLDKEGKPVVEAMKQRPTMAMLMTHTAGFGYGLRDDNYVDQQFQKQGVLRANGLREAMLRIAGIPLLYQPGTRWSYSAAVDIQGYIVEQLSGQRFGDFLADHLFKPLGMKDSAFFAPAGQAGRLTAVYAVDRETGKLIELGGNGGAFAQDFTKPPALESGGAGAVSTVDDYARFCQMILNEGVYNGVRILAPATVALMRSDHIPDTVVPEASTFGGPAIGGPLLGFGLDFAVSKQPTRMGSEVGAGTIWWGGAAGTWFWIDPKNDLFFLGMVQRFGGGAAGSASLNTLSQTLVYAALTDPEK